MNDLILTFFAQAKSAAPQAQGMGGFTMIGFFVIWIGILYFLMIRPQKLKAEKQRQLVAKLKKGDKIITDSGFHGEIANVQERTFMVKLADKVIIEVEQTNVRAVAVMPEEPSTTKVEEKVG